MVVDQRDGLGGDLAVWKGPTPEGSAWVGGGSRVSLGGGGPVPKRECACATRGAAIGRNRRESAYQCEVSIPGLRGNILLLRRFAFTRWSNLTSGRGAKHLSLDWPATTGGRRPVHGSRGSARRVAENGQPRAAPTRIRRQQPTVGAGLVPALPMNPREPGGGRPPDGGGVVVARRRQERGRARPGAQYREIGYPNSERPRPRCVGGRALAEPQPY